MLFRSVEQLYCAPGNGGIAALAQCVPLSATDVDGVVAWAQTHSIDFVVVAPDDPLALGMVDALEDAISFPLQIVPILLSQLFRDRCYNLPVNA